MANSSIQKIMTDNREVFTRIVRSGISNSEIAKQLSEEINEVVSVPQVARFKREFGLIKNAEKPAELVIEKRPRCTASLGRVLNLIFKKQIVALEKHGLKMQIREKIFDVGGKQMNLDELNALVAKKSEEEMRGREKEEAVAKLKALGVSERELIKLLRNA